MKANLVTYPDAGNEVDLRLSRTEAEHVLADLRELIEPEVSEGLDALKVQLARVLKK
jgi:hypothetical protein